MAKSLIVNRIGGKNHFITVPATSLEAETFATTFLDGEYAVYETASTLGSDVVATAPVKFNVMFKNSTTGEKSYGNFVLPATKTENDLFNVLMGKTINGVLIDYVYTLSQRTVEKF